MSYLAFYFVFISYKIYLYLFILILIFVFSGARFQEFGNSYGKSYGVQIRKM